ncbi:hypothetical protein CYMTET_30512, partial [Cymbomonas tetramitiformis]
VDKAFARTGIQSYLVDEALSEVQRRASAHLEVLAGGSLTLELSATRKAKSRAGTVERIEKIVQARGPHGEWHQRTVRQLSGGEQRRVALALTLAFSEFALARDGSECDLLVLDEVLQSLDGEGTARAAALLRLHPSRTVIVIAQAHSTLTQLVDDVDVVAKHAGLSGIIRET